MEAQRITYEYRFLPERGCVRIDSLVEVMLGYEASDFLANPALLFDILHPQDRGDYFSLLAGDVSMACVRWLRRDGSSVWCEHTLTPRWEAGQLVAVEGVAAQVAPPPGRCGRVRPVCERLVERAPQR